MRIISRFGGNRNLLLKRHRHRLRVPHPRRLGPRKVAMISGLLLRLMLTRPLNSPMRLDIAAICLDAHLDLTPCIPCMVAQ